MKKIDVNLALGNGENMIVAAYQSPTEGLTVHREVAYVPGKEEHKFTSRWQITHTASGRSVLKPSECRDTMSEAMDVAKALGSWSWVDKEPFDIDTSAAVREDLRKILAEGTTPTEKIESKLVRYVVRRNQDGPGYIIFDTETEKAVEAMIHRGLASEKARDLNGSVST